MLDSVLETLSNLFKELVLDMTLLRPEVLSLLLLLPLFAWLNSQQFRNQSIWQKVVDPHLLKFLLQDRTTKFSAWPSQLLIISFVLAIFAAAGPSWQEQSSPVYRTGDARVILLDLSFSMDAVDIKPSRIARARQKLRDILELSREGETALVVYAGDAFVISPLTSDANTIASMVPDLSPGIMPIFGSEPYLAVEKAKELLTRAGKPQGTIIWITDGIETIDADNIADTLDDTSIDVRVLAVGTEAGAPIPLANQQGFLTDSADNIVLPSLRLEPFQQLAQQIPLSVVQISADNSDIDFIMGQTLTTDSSIDQAEQEDEEKNQQHLDQGYWVLLALLPLMLLLFRKNARVPGIAGALLLTSWQPKVEAGIWEDLWLNKNQRAERAFNQEKHAEAAQLFNIPDWQAAAEFKSGNHASAEKIYSQSNTADGLYNLGNSLAKQSKFDEAIEAYNKALELNPNDPDTLFNKELVEQLKQQQEQEEQQNQQQEQDQQSQSEEQQEQQQNQSQESDQSEQEQEQSEQNQDSSESEQNQQPMDLQDQRSEAEKDQALEQWLRKIPDEPGRLLREKMRREYKRRGRENRNTKKVW